MMMMMMMMMRLTDRQMDRRTDGLGTAKTALHHCSAMKNGTFLRSSCHRRIFKIHQCV